MSVFLLSFSARICYTESTREKRKGTKQLKQTGQAAVPLFMTHHAPVGSWSSFTFGAAGLGASVDLEAPMVSDSADFLVGTAQDGVLTTLPFSRAAGKPTGPDVLAEGNKETAPVKKPVGWNYLPASAVRRTLGACVDTFAAENMTLRVYTPHYPLEDPRKGAISPEACCPGLLMELEVDNTQGSTPATGFLGISWKADGRIYTVDTAGVEGLTGLGWRDDWMLAATKTETVYTVRGHDLEEQLRIDRRLLHQTAAGALCIRVAPGERAVLTAAFGFYKEGAGSNGIATRYYYTRCFDSAAAVCRSLLGRAAALTAYCRTQDEAWRARFAEDWQYVLFAQAVRGYAASTQLLCDESGRVYYNVGEGAYVWRNTMDLAVDHLAWELKQNPWVVRNIIDLYIERYSYRDTVRFADRPGEEFPGGLTFTHDMGNYFTYSPAGYSGYERETTPKDGCYLYMTTEELLNGVCVLAAYGLYTGDDDWMQARRETALALLESLENRDDASPERRDGVLKAQSTRCGPQGKESTTYDALDHSLMDSRGSVYIQTKTVAALLLLGEFLTRTGETAAAARAADMRQKAEQALERFYDAERDCLRANLYDSVASLVLGAIEPLGMIALLGMTDRLPERLRELLCHHVRACLQSGACAEEETGGLRMSSTSNNTFVSKVALSLFVMGEVLGMEIPKASVAEMLHWCQVCAERLTISDQVLVDKRQVIGGCYYPRIITAAFWMRDI